MKTSSAVHVLRGRIMIEDFESKIKHTIEYLPPMPMVMSELINALHDDDMDLNGLGRIISKDPSMTMNVLKVANSAFYGLHNTVSSIEHAVRMLGPREITSLCIACSAGRILNPLSGKPAIEVAIFWRHSVATGVFAKMLASELNIGLLNNIYLAGLVHDVGKTVLDRFAHDIYGNVMCLMNSEGISMAEAERLIIGISHDVVGAWLMEKWQLPSIFGWVAKNHHGICEVPQEFLIAVAIVALADHLAWDKGFGFGSNTSRTGFKATEAFKALDRVSPGMRGLDFMDFISTLDKASEEINELERVMSGNRP